MSMKQHCDGRVQLKLKYWRDRKLKEPISIYKLMIFISIRKFILGDHCFAKFVFS